MKRNRLYFSLIIAMLAVIVVWASCQMWNVGKEEKEYKVSVIVENSSLDRWSLMRQGLEQAARDYPIDLNYVSTSDFEDVSAELDVIHREIENGADGVIVQMASGGSGADIESFGAKTSVVLIETDVTPEDFYTVVEPDNAGMGEALAATVALDYGAEVPDRRIGILSGNQEQLAMQQRLSGVTNGLEEKGARIAWCIEGKAKQAQEAFAAAMQNTPVDVLIVLGNDELEMVMDEFAAGELAGSGCALYGVGCSEKTVYYLDKGWIDTLVVPNEFNMGYQSMEKVAGQLLYHTQEAEKQEVDYLVVNRTNLYDDDIQKILFPIVQ